MPTATAAFEHPASLAHRLAADPRHYQILVLTSLLIYGVWRLDLAVHASQALAIVAAAFATQALLARASGAPRLDLKSACISALSLCLLLRTGRPALAVAAAVLAIASKFLLRVRGKHLWNPTNFGIVALILATRGKVWVSPGQWGSAAFFGFLLLCLGSLVVRRAARGDITWAFLAFYGGILLGRALWLGQRLAIPLHQLESGAFLIFTFFMISDPKTTPDSRAGRILFAALVAAAAAWVQFALYRPIGMLLALAFLAPLVPLIDRLLPGESYRWPQPTLSLPERRPRMSRLALPVAFSGRPRRPLALPPALLLLLLLTVCGAHAAHAFCGFYVAKADTKLYNKASQVVLVRDGERTVMTMANDFKGDPQEFAMVVPVPTLLERKQIHVAGRALIDHLDAYSAPRLVEYFDEDPCLARPVMAPGAVAGMAVESAKVPSPAARARSLGVTIEATYTVGEYDILILSAKQSDGLETWLRENGYRVPPGASRVLGTYLRLGMHFFVAKVNLKEQSQLGYTSLRPLQIAYESPRFMLPIRLGMVNANGPQELFVYTLTLNGRVETTNYRTTKLPSGDNVPIFVKDQFGSFYKAMFSHQVAKEDMRTVFLEYAWNMGFCDPCSADPLSPEELRGLGVFWLDSSSTPTPTPTAAPGGWQRRPGASAAGGATFLTRLHVRYDAEHFPEDLMFQETGDTETFQGRYVLQHPWTGGGTCEAAAVYRRNLRVRLQKEARTLAGLTGWDIDRIRGQMNLPTLRTAPPAEKPWWDGLWGQ
jgi:Na+-translocating ferredoxin:NAD+ oxidoreductase RnfD subunit